MISTMWWKNVTNPLDATGDLGFLLNQVFVSIPKWDLWEIEDFIPLWEINDCCALHTLTSNLNLT